MPSAKSDGGVLSSPKARRAPSPFPNQPASLPHNLVLGAHSRALVVCDREEIHNRPCVGEPGFYGSAINCRSDGGPLPLKRLRGQVGCVMQGCFHDWSSRPECSAYVRAVAFAGPYSGQRLAALDVLVNEQADLHGRPAVGVRMLEIRGDTDGAVFHEAIGLPVDVHPGATCLCSRCHSRPVRAFRPCILHRPAGTDRS